MAQARRAQARRPLLGLAVSIALWAALAGNAALVAHDFYRHVDKWVFLSVDDGLSNEAYTLASQGRYGFLSSPEISGVERHHGEVSYGPWYFYLAGGLTPENVGEAIRIVRPYAVDVCSRIESSPGKKDPEKLRRFIAAVKGTI